MMLVMGMGFTSCSDDDNDEPDATTGDATSIVGKWKLYEEDESGYYSNYLTIYEDGEWESEWTEASHSGYIYQGDDYGTYTYSNGKVNIISVKYGDTETYIVTMPNNNTLVLREADDDESDTYTRVN